MSTKKKSFSLNSFFVIVIIIVTAIVPVLTTVDTVGVTEDLMLAESMSGSTTGNAISSMQKSQLLVSTENDNNTTGGAIDSDATFDVALKTEITNVYFMNGTLISKENQVPSFGVYGSNDERYPSSMSAVPAYKNGYIQVKNTIYNQGTAPIKNVGMRIYYNSEAYEHVLEGTGDIPKNRLWVTVPKSTISESPAWIDNDFVVKTNTFTDIVGSNSNSSQDFYLKVKDSNLSPEQYYIASEIVSFQDSYGNDKSEYDVDSIPNANPNDDLNGQSISFINGNYEKDNVISEAGVTSIGETRIRQYGDEDDFDFTYALLNDNFYDMALQTNISNVFESDGSFYKDNGLSGKRHAHVPTGGAIELSVNLINQGSLSVRNSVVYVYVPKAGYVLIDNSQALNDRPSVDMEDSIWSIVDNPSILPSSDAYMESDYYVIQGNFSTKLSPGNSSYTLPKLYFNVLNPKDYKIGDFSENVSTNPAYYISAEIVEFSDETGTRTTSDATNSIHDIDSVPDINPNNDLYYNNSTLSFQTNIIHHLATFGFVKERDGEITKRGYTIPDLNARTQLPEDEDDFDFTFIDVLR